MTNEIFRNESVAENESFTQKYFTTTGRIDRLTFLKRSLIAFVALFLLTFTAGIIGYLVSSNIATAEMVMSITSLAVIIPQYFLNAKRLHDIGRDETLAKVFVGVGILQALFTFSTASIIVNATMALSIVTFIFTLYLLFKKGEEVNNEYGMAK